MIPVNTLLAQLRGNDLRCVTGTLQRLDDIVFLLKTSSITMEHDKNNSNWSEVFFIDVFLSFMSRVIT